MDLGTGTAGARAPGDRTVLTRAADAVREVYDAAAASVAVVADDGEVLLYRAAAGEGADAIVGTSLPVGRGLAGWVAMSGQPLFVHDVRSDPRFARDVAEATRYVPEAMLLAPFHDADGEVAGVVSVLDPAGVTSPESAVAGIGTLAALVGLVAEAGGGGAAGEPQVARLADYGRRVLSLAAELDL
ncbi:GAF domain-containing protein [Aquipuribacter sp. SD81]|uniref:GAF domain-containing protein n=1 Tax=Aquipuribacter sp. SD81 TaxID=3127703 RepID=UPI003017971B